MILDSQHKYGINSCLNVFPCLYSELYIRWYWKEDTFEFTARNKRMVQRGNQHELSLALILYCRSKRKTLSGLRMKMSNKCTRHFRVVPRRWGGRRGIAPVPRAPCLTSARLWWRPVGRLPASTSEPRSYRRSAPPSCYSRSSGCSPESQTWTRTFSLPVDLTVLCCFSVDP